MLLFRLNREYSGMDLLLISVARLSPELIDGSPSVDRVRPIPGHMLCIASSGDRYEPK